MVEVQAEISEVVGPTNSRAQDGIVNLWKSDAFIPSELNASLHVLRQSPCYDST